VAPTFDCAAECSQRFQAKVDKLLRRKRMHGVDWVGDWSTGIRRLRKQYVSNAMFDLSDATEGKEQNWALGSTRFLVVIKDVLSVDGKGVVVFRTSARYKVDATILRGAKRLHIYARTPSGFDILEYRDLVKKRSHEARRVLTTV
jgi:hypothetical protein